MNRSPKMNGQPVLRTTIGNRVTLHPMKFEDNTWMIDFQETVEDEPIWYAVNHWEVRGDVYAEGYSPEASVGTWDVVIFRDGGNHEPIMKRRSFMQTVS